MLQEPESDWTAIQEIGFGDDQDEDKWETAWSDWLPELWNELGTEEPGVAEAEAAQEGADLGLGPVGDGFKQGVDHRFVQVQGFGLVLLEIARHHVVLSKAGFSFAGLLQAHHQSQQGGLPSAIRADKSS